jgi:hypothetical protein
MTFDHPNGTGPVAPLDPRVIDVAASPEPTLGSPGGSPDLDLPTPKAVTLHLASRDVGAECQFWIGIAAQGSQSPGKLMDLEEVPALLTEAAIRGVHEAGPVMLSDTRRKPPRFIYLLPRPPKDEIARLAWVQELVDTLRSWAPQSAGLYIAPEVMAMEDAAMLLRTILAQAIRETATRDFHLLTGTWGLNPILNAALRLKKDLESEALPIHVFH